MDGKSQVENQLQVDEKNNQNLQRSTQATNNEKTKKMKRENIINLKLIAMNWLHKVISFMQSSIRALWDLSAFYD